MKAAPSARAVEVDGALVARGLGLEVEAFRRLMEQRKVTVLCERGTGEDEGRYRATFYYAGKRLRLVVDGDGTPVVGPSPPALALPGPQA